MTPMEAAEWLRGCAAKVEPTLETVVAGVVISAAAIARGLPGHLQPEWKPLHPATINGFRHESGKWIEGKAALGFDPPDYQPLERTGQMAHSIESDVDGLIGVIGSRDKVMLWQEMGTPDARYPIEPRPVLALAMQKAIPIAEELMADALQTIFALD